MSFDAWQDWQAELARRLGVSIAFFYGNFIRGTRRAVIDGYVDLALGRLDAAELLFNDGRGRFQELGMPRDVALAVFYLVLVSVQRRDVEATRRLLREAADWARAAGLEDAPLVLQLVAAFDDGIDIADEVRAITRRAGGCLGPRGPRRTRD